MRTLLLLILPLAVLSTASSTAQCDGFSCRSGPCMNSSQCGLTCTCLRPPNGGLGFCSNLKPN